jgi:hypothetical protein
MMMTIDELDVLKRRLAPKLLRLPGVIGVGVEEDDDGTGRLTIHLESDEPAVRESLPQEVDGERVHYVVTGAFHPHGAEIGSAR